MMSGKEFHEERNRRVLAETKEKNCDLSMTRDELHQMMEGYAAYCVAESNKGLVEAANNIIAHRHYNAWAADRSNAMDALAAALAAAREGK